MNETDLINNSDNITSIDIEKDDTPDTEVITPECLKYAKGIYNCFPDKLLSSKDLCDRYYSNECQALLKQDKNICNNNQYKLILEFKILIPEFICAKNENGNYCRPLVVMYDTFK